MTYKLLIIILILAIAAQGMALNVPSQGEQVPEQETAIRGESGGYTEGELILIIVGAVCGTVILLSIIN